MDWFKIFCKEKPLGLKWTFKELKCLGIWCGPNIENAILESNLGINPQLDGALIRLPIPKLSEERRNELSKIASQYAENFKISIRNVRRKFIDLVKDLEKNKSISMDDSKKFQDDIQKSTDLSISKIFTISNT